MRVSVHMYMHVVFMYITDLDTETCSVYPVIEFITLL